MRNAILNVAAGQWVIFLEHVVISKRVGGLILFQRPESRFVLEDNLHVSLFRCVQGKPVNGYLMEGVNALQTQHLEESTRFGDIQIRCLKVDQHSNSTLARE